MLGKYLRVEATTTEGSVAFVMGPIAPEGSLRLANISIAVEGCGSVTDKATLIAKPVLTAGKVPPAGSVTYEWRVAESASGPFEPIAGATGSRLELAKSHVGSYIRVVATAGGYNQVKATAGPVLDARSAEAAKAALDGFTPQPVFGESQNVREIVQTKLDELGFTQAKVRVKSAETGAGGATVSSAEGTGNGQVTFYYEDPEGDVPGSARIKVVFEISSRGTTAEWARLITVRWDMGRVAERLEQLVDEELRASSLVIAEGGTADNATNAIEARKDLSLGGSLGTCADLTWSTSDPKVIGPDGVIKRKQSEDAHARLTATARFNKAVEGEKAPQISKDFDVTVKSIDSDPTVEQVLDEALAKLPLKDMGTKEPIDPAAVTGDIQLPTIRSMGLKGVHKVKYEVVSGDGACSIYGYTLNVTRPAPGMPDAHAVLKVALTKKAGENLPQDVTRTRSIDLVIKALDTVDIDRELDLMQRAKDGYAQALLGANDDPRSVTQSLDEFKQVRDDGNGGLVWARTSAEVEGMGIAPVSIDLSHPSEQWDKFRSSAPAVIESETLRLLKTPEYNTRVKITSCLSSEKYGDYYEKLKDDPSIDPAVLAKYRALSRQEVSALLHGARRHRPRRPERPQGHGGERARDRSGREDGRGRACAGVDPAHRGDRRARREPDRMGCLRRPARAQRLHLQHGEARRAVLHHDPRRHAHARDVRRRAVVVLELPGQRRVRGGLRERALRVERRRDRARLRGRVGRGAPRERHRDHAGRAASQLGEPVAELHDGHQAHGRKSAHGRRRTGLGGMSWGRYPRGPTVCPMCPTPSSWATTSTWPPPTA